MPTAVPAAPPPAPAPPPARGRARPAGGFTLIELVVVVIIIAVLAILAVRNYGSFVFQARDGAAVQNATQVDQALAIRSLLDDRPPRVEVALAAASGRSLADYLGVSAQASTFTVDNAASPSTVNVHLDNRDVCLTLGTNVGQRSQLDRHAC